MVPPTLAVIPSKEGGREKLKYSTIEKREEMKIKNPQITIGLHDIPIDNILEQNFHPSRGLLVHVNTVAIIMMVMF